MAFLSPSLPFLVGVENPEFFTSPFPSDYSSPKLNALGGLSAANIAKAGASAWSTAQQIALKAKAVHVGDLRTDWLSQMVKEDPQSGALIGAFAAVSWPNSTDPQDFRNSMVNSGFDMAETIISAVPVYGKIVAAVLDVAQFFYNAFQKTEEEIEALVPWQRYSQGLDEDMAKLVVFPAMEKVDWTRLFWPALRWETGFRMFKTEEGANTRAWGTFATDGGDVDLTTNAPGSDSGGGLGFMPGTQKMADVIQLTIGGKASTASTRIDAITAVGNFFPATAQSATVLWEMVRQTGSPDMYKVRAGELKDGWDAYFDSMRGSFVSQWEHFWARGNQSMGRDECVNLGKIVSPYLTIGEQGAPYVEGTNNRWIWPGMTRKNGIWQLDPGDGRPHCSPDSGERYSNPASGWLTDTSYQAGAVFPPDRCADNYNRQIRENPYAFLDNYAIEPACQALKEAQHRALYRTNICAYVRPDDVGGLPRYGAFNDTSSPIGAFSGTFGEQLRERCLYARQELLSRDLRFRVRLEDVDDIDPTYAAALRDSGVNDNSWRNPAHLGLSAGPLGEAEPIPPSDGPRGGAPFQATYVPPGGGGGGLLIAAGVAAAAFAVAKSRG
jgi:hypothetical protein